MAFGESAQPKQSALNGSQSLRQISLSALEDNGSSLLVQNTTAVTVWEREAVY